MKVALSCTVTLGREALELVYTVANQEPHEIGVFNWIKMNRPDGTLAFLSSMAYVELVDDILLVRKMALPIPEQLQMAAYVLPPASPIAGKGQFVERIVLGLPVQVMQPFRAALVGLKGVGEVVADKPAKARLLRLEVGVFPIDEQCRLEAENPAHPRAFTVHPPGPAVTRQQVLKFDVRLDRAVDVLDYRSVPWP